ACKEDSSAGTYVDGTIDPSSLTYNPDTGDIKYSFSNYADGSGSRGAGVIGAQPEPNDNIAAFANALNATRPGDAILALAGASITGGVAAGAALGALGGSALSSLALEAPDAVAE